MPLRIATGHCEQPNIATPVTLSLRVVVEFFSGNAAISCLSMID